MSVKGCVEGSIKESIKGSFKEIVKESVKGSVKRSFNGNCLVKGALKRFLKVFYLKHQISYFYQTTFIIMGALSHYFFRYKNEFSWIFLFRLENFYNE